MKLKLYALLLCSFTSASTIFAQAWTRDAATATSRLTTASDKVGLGTATVGTGIKFQVTNKTQMDSLFVLHANPLFSVRTNTQYYYYTNITPTELTMSLAAPAMVAISRINAGTAFFGTSGASSTTINQNLITIISPSAGECKLNNYGLIVKGGAGNAADSTVVNASFIRTKTIYVGTSGWAINAPDYVFKANYHLMSLKKVEQFIDKNGHLPEVPSAADMEKRGSVNLVEMNMVLLKKVEELTLHTIALEKRITELEQDKTTR